MNLPTTWRQWLRSLVAAIVGGGSSAVSSGIATIVIAPEKFSPTTQLKSFSELIATTFLIGAASHLFAFLQKSPVPDAPPIPPAAP